MITDENSSLIIKSQDAEMQETDIRLEVLRGVSVLPGGIANLLLQLTRTMKCSNASLEDIMTVQKSICEQFGVRLPDCFMASISKKQYAGNSANLLETIIYKIYCSEGEKVWLGADDMKQKYPELRNYSRVSIGKAATSIGIPSKCTHGHYSYLMPGKTDEGGSAP